MGPRWDVSLATMDIQSANYLKIRIRRSNYDGSWTVTICHPFRPAQAGRHSSYLAEHLCHTCSWRIPSRYNHSHLKRRTRVGNSHWYILNIIIHDILCNYSSGARKNYTHLIDIFWVILKVERLTFNGLNSLQSLPKNPRWLTTGCERSNMAVMHLWHLHCTWNADVLWIYAFLTPKTPTTKCNASQQKEKTPTNSQGLAFTDRVRFNLGPFGTADFFAEVPCQLRSMVQVVPTTSTTSIVSQNSTWKNQNSSIQPMDSTNMNSADSIGLHTAASVENSPLLPWQLEKTTKVATWCTASTTRCHNGAEFMSVWIKDQSCAGNSRAAIGPSWTRTWT